MSFHSGGELTVARVDAALVAIPRRTLPFRLTPAALAKLLTVVWSDPSLRQPFLASLAIAGRNGTLEHRLRRRPALGNVRAKTGTTNSASALSGYVRNRYAFVILQNGNPVSSTQARAAQDRFVTLLAAQ